MRTILRQARKLAAVVAPLLAGAVAIDAATVHAAPAPAGTVISNFATATYFHEGLGILETVRSNTVTASIQAVPALDVVGGSTLRLTRSTEGSHTFRIRNIGNVPLRIDASIIENAGDDFDVIGTLYHDVDGDGAVDRIDPVMSDTLPLTLAPGDSIPVIYLFVTPGTVVTDDRAVSTLTATGIPVTGDPTPLTDADDGIAVIDDSLRLSKTAAHDEDAGRIRYTLSLRNNSERTVAPYSTVDGEPILIDGAPRTVILVRDDIPLNTVFAETRPTGVFEPVYNLVGAARHSYVSAPPVDPSRIAAIAFVTEENYEVGRSLDLVFSVDIGERAGEVAIVNTAIAYLEDGGEVVASTSNEVETPVDGADGILTFFAPDFSAEVDATSYGEDVAVELIAGVCNLSREIDEVTVTLSTSLSADRESLLATETGPNTGVFRTTSIPIRRVSEATVMNAVLEPLENDVVSGTAICNGTTIEDAVTVNPGGYIFDAITNDPVGGATVELFEIGIGGALLQTTTSAANGFFSFDRVERGSYRIQVTPPSTFSFPSAYVQFDGYRRQVDARASYGTTFTFAGGPLTNIDVPVDPTDILPLTLNKSANRDEARRGEYVVYTLETENRTGQALAQAVIEDTLPPGFLFVSGSAMIDGEEVDDPTGAPGRELVFDLGLFTPDTLVTVEYAVRIAPTSGQGRRINTAIVSGTQAFTGRTIASQPARAIVRVDDRGGVFADEAVVIGRVFLDTDGNGVQTDDVEEPGIPGVKIVTSNGFSVVTDEHGRYSLFGLRPATQVFAVQGSTLPEGAAVALSQADDALKPGSRFIDLKRGELRAEDFPVAWTEEVEAAVAERRASFDALAIDESLLRDDLPLTFEGGVKPLSRRSENALETVTDIDRRRQADAADTDPIEGTWNRPVETQVEREKRLADLLPTLSADFGFVGIEDGAVSDLPVLDILVKSPPKAAIVLKVNGEEVPTDRIGAKLIGDQVQLYEFVAVPLVAGTNTIETSVTDPFGNERGKVTRTVYAPGAPAALQIIAPETASANASSRLPVVVRVVDAEGRLVRAPVTVTLEAERGTWDVRDIRTQVGGLQAFIDNGEATFDFIPPALVGRETLRAEAEFGFGEAVMGITPDLGERVLVGVIEGAVRLTDEGADLAGLMEDDEFSHFEETTEGVRGQLYLKGRIFGENLLTLRYDSDQDTEERLFRDIRRDEFYPVYGDNSEYGFDAQSSSKLFVKVERGQSYILYGDIAVEPEADAIRLGAFRRSLTGVKGRYQHGRVSVTVFAAETELGQRVVEFDSRGVSGPYDVALEGLRDGSEVVEIITRDRDQPARIIDVLPQTRLSDYSIDYFTGSLIFDRPIPLTDDAFNPVSIRITFETEDGLGEKYFVYGGEAAYAITDDITVGYRELRTSADEGNEERREVRSAYIDARIGDWQAVQVEVTNSRNDEGDDAFGYRATYDYTGERTTLRAEVARTEEGFDVPGSYIGEGRDEARIIARHRLGERTEASLDALYTRDTIGDRERYGAEALLTRSITNYLDASVGMRAVHTSADGEGTDVLSGIAGLRYRPPQVPGAAFLLEFEQDFVELDNWRLTAGADYQWRPDLRFYALNELSTAETGFFGIGDGRSTNFTTKVGVEFDVTDDISGFSEYRDGGIGGGTGNGVANGIRGSWAATEVTTLRATIEHLEPVSDEQQRNSAITVGVDYDDRDRGLLARADLEWDRDEDGYGLFSNLAFGYEIDDDFTLLLRNRFAFDDKGRFDRIRDRLRFGVAYRPVAENRLRMLGWYEYEIDEEENREQAHRWSAAVTWTQSERLRANLRYAGEYSEFRSVAVEDSNTLHMVNLGAEYDFFDDRLALAGNVALFTDQEMDNYALGYGAELKVAVTKGLQIGVGYNHVDLEEDRVRSLYRSGFYLRGKLKLDDDLWDSFDGAYGTLVGE